MTTVVLDKLFADTLRGCRTMTALKDSEGKLLGYFDPSERYVFDEGETPAIDEEELDRRVTRWEGIPSEEVRRRLLERK